MRGSKSIFVSSKHKIKCFLIYEKYFQTTNAVDTLPLRPRGLAFSWRRLATFHGDRICCRSNHHARSPRTGYLPPPSAPWQHAPQRLYKLCTMVRPVARSKASSQLCIVSGGSEMSSASQSRSSAHFSATMLRVAINGRTYCCIGCWRQCITVVRAWSPLVDRFQFHAGEQAGVGARVPSAPAGPCLTMSLPAGLCLTGLEPVAGSFSPSLSSTNVGESRLPSHPNPGANDGANDDEIMKSVVDSMREYANRMERKKQHRWVPTASYPAHRVTRAPRN